MGGGLYRDLAGLPAVSYNRCDIVTQAHVHATRLLKKGKPTSAIKTNLNPLYKDNI